MVFSFVTLVVLFNLLTAMMATTFRLITERSDKKVPSRKVALGVEYDRQSQVLPPLFNMLVVLVFVLAPRRAAAVLFAKVLFRELRTAAMEVRALQLPQQVRSARP